MCSADFLFRFVNILTTSRNQNQDLSQSPSPVYPHTLKEQCLSIRRLLWGPQFPFEFCHHQNLCLSLSQFPGWVPWFCRSPSLQGLLEQWATQALSFGKDFISALCNLPPIDSIFLWLEIVHTLFMFCHDTGSLHYRAYLKTTLSFLQLHFLSSQCTFSIRTASYVSCL